MIRYNSSLTQFEIYNGTAWVAFTTTGTATPVAWGWGNNIYGRLGNGTTSSYSSPVSVVGGFTDWAQITTGVGHVLAIRANGTAWGWGFNANGIIGNATTTSYSSPVSVVGGFTDWVQVDGGTYHSAGIRGNGTAWSWGRNNAAQLGDASVTNRSSPVSVVGGFTDWTQISAGWDHTVAIRANGTAWGWGSSSAGQVGFNTSGIAYLSPVLVVGGFTDWTQIDAGVYHTAAIRANGTAWGWGFNLYGQLGDNSITSRLSPVSVVGGFTNWVQISAGGYFVMAIRSNGTAWGWGGNSSGQLGTNNTSSYSSPVSVVGGFTDWIQINAALYHTVAIRANGTAWAWGNNAVGGLGDATTTNRSSPVSVVGGFTDWVQVVGGSYHSVGLRAG
jgi:alpha-tubulin suppressor-like RCC1 family protein